MPSIAETLDERELRSDALGRALGEILSGPTGRTAAGHPYIERPAWEALRDRTPMLFVPGLEVLRRVDEMERAAARSAADEEQLGHFQRSCQVVRQVIRTAAITAPSDLWLLRHVLAFLAELGLLERLLAGEAIYPGKTIVTIGGRRQQLDPEELDTDLRFLLSRGFTEQYEESFRIAGHPLVREVLQGIRPVPVAADISRAWRALYSGRGAPPEQLAGLQPVVAEIPQAVAAQRTHWIPSLEEIEIGYLLVPLVLGLRANGRTAGIESGSPVSLEVPGREAGSEAEAWLENMAGKILAAAGWVEERPGALVATELGARCFARAPGPFGIIETYHDYMEHGARILLEGRGSIRVSRGENIGASQDANRKTFEQANDALDRFVADTGFSYSVFIEHAIGRGEATRQRYERSGDASIRYFGADLEDAAIDAAQEEQASGRLPQDMVFVRQADIGHPNRLLEALAGAGVDSHGAVMLVGNGFHEVRNQTDEGMIEVFRGYCEAGIILLFTEENALSIDDLRATAWNTYHAGFKYVHEKSGQGLRPADQRPQVRLGPPLRASWRRCATDAGYVRFDDYCTRTRTIYPYTRPGSRNPAISVNHFFVPGAIAAEIAQR